MHRIIVTSTIHKRYRPKKHSFCYRAPYLWIDMYQLHTLSNPLFGFNKKRLYSFFESDYLSTEPLTLLEKWEALRLRFHLPSTKHLYLVTMPRFILPNFNPVSFYLASSDNTTIDYVVAEVSNTYHEKHLYVLPPDLSKGPYLRHQQNKAFHVSPFLPDDGIYEFAIKRNLHPFEVHITYKKEASPYLYAHLIETHQRAYSAVSLCITTLKYPVAILATFPRILKEAFTLHYLKKIPASCKPNSDNPDTIRKVHHHPKQTLYQKLVKTLFNRFKWGSLRIQLPDGRDWFFGISDSKDAQLTVRTVDVFKQWVRRGELGFAETYINGQWDSDDLLAVLMVLLRNKHQIKEAQRGKKSVRYVEWFKHFLRRNTLIKAKQNIQSHYDLSNAMYQLFLDANMLYSSALWANSTDSLEAAQQNKLDTLYKSLSIEPHHHVLEIGSGWGYAAIRLAQNYGCKVTTLTLSQAQYECVLAKIKEANLEGQVQVLLKDYRVHQGNYDRLFSIEMIEAVGHRYLGTYFEAIDRLLKPEGIATIQAILIPDQRYDAYLNRRDFIQTYIFPGGHLPSLGAVLSAIKKNSSFILTQFNDMTPHYAKTLDAWKKRFISNQDAIQTLGFDATFLRKWVYYFDYCQAGFINRYIQVAQLTFTRPVNKAVLRHDAIFFNEETRYEHLF